MSSRARTRRKRRRDGLPAARGHAATRSAAHPRAGHRAVVSQAEARLRPADRARRPTSAAQDRADRRAIRSQDRLYRMVEACVPDATDARLGFDLDLIARLSHDDRAFDSDYRGNGAGDRDRDSKPYTFASLDEVATYQQTAMAYFSNRRAWVRERVGPLERARAPRTADASDGEERATVLLPPGELAYPQRAHPWAAAQDGSPAVAHAAAWTALTRDPVYARTELALRFVDPAVPPLAPMPAVPDDEDAVFSTLADVAAALREAAGDTARVAGATAAAEEAGAGALWVGLSAELALVLWCAVPPPAQTLGVRVWTVRWRHYVPRAWPCPAAGYAGPQAARSRGSDDDDDARLATETREQGLAFYEYGQGSDGDHAALRAKFGLPGNAQ